MSSAVASSRAVRPEPLEVLLDTPRLPTFNLPDVLSAAVTGTRLTLMPACLHLFLGYALPRERGLPPWEALHA